MKYILLLFLILFSMPAVAKNGTTLDLKTFETLPVQHGGRIKPIDSFSKTMLQTISGSESVDGLQSASWLAEVLFAPAKAIERPIFRLFKPDIINLPAQKRLFSYSEIAPALTAKSELITKLATTDPAKWSADQVELMRIHENSLLFTQLLRSFSMLLPLNLDIPQEVRAELPARDFITLESYRGLSKKIDDRVQAIVKKKGSDLSKFTAKEQALAAFSFEMKTIEAGAQNNILFRIIPGSWGEGEKSTWFSPWALIQQGQGSPEAAPYLDSWRSMAHAFIENDTGRWNQSVRQAHETAKTFAKTETTQMELAYNKFHPLTLALLLYFAAVLLFSLHAIFPANALSVLAIASTVLGCCAHALAITLRILVLERPPVGTLYESILFVAFICVLCGLVYEYFRRDKAGLLAAGASGTFLLFIAKSFTGEDNMQVLVAVLNTNFWLATHVLCITIGYAWCLFASFLAHLWLFRKATGKDETTLTIPVKMISLIALLFTATGTILGGIWADQSWGRFWGWDPKENGALLIVLWLLWALHARIAQQINDKLFMALISALSIIVGIAWFGVNLLNVGLHSYGFISGVATSLGLFCAIELALITYLFIGGKKHAA